MLSLPTRTCVTHLPFRLTRVAAALFCTLAMAVSAAAQAAESTGPLAFPGAQGWAAHTVGGRGGKLLRVTTLAPTGPGSLPGVAYPAVTAPEFGVWSGRGADMLVQGYVRAASDGQLTVGCYLYDVALGQELARQGYVVAPGEWRRAAHKCADMV